MSSFFNFLTNGKYKKINRVKAYMAQGYGMKIVGKKTKSNDSKISFKILFVRSLRDKFLNRKFNYFS